MYFFFSEIDRIAVKIVDSRNHLLESVRAEETLPPLRLNEERKKRRTVKEMRKIETKRTQ